MKLSDYNRVRPVLYHLTARSNLPHIKAAGTLQAAATFYEASGRSYAGRVRRERPEHIQADGRTVVVRDQIPLREANCDLLDGWTFEDLIQHLNNHVFFWPGSEFAPIEAGLNYFRRYRDEDAVVIRCRFANVVDANMPEEPRFTRFNSGAPRYSGGRPSPRGPRTFQPANVYGGTPSTVTEVVYARRVNLPSHYDVLMPADWRAML